MALPARFACIGAVAAGTTGAIVGLVVGLVTYAPTAWFAVFELGLPATIAGGAVGLISGFAVAFVLSATHRIRGHGGGSRR
ncbi:MAG TPA: hypothetical protein VHW26_07100 [Solirubrobacteraceae bacterium]|nr:hypothetical protein [Solirubrobacteraceae bacterium]